MKILVTGGAGFIGSHLVERLVQLNHEALVIDDLSNGTYANLLNVADKIAFVEHDVSKHFISNSILRQHRQLLNNLDVIFHLACWPRSRSFSNPPRDVEVNVIGMVHILELARRNNTKVIFSSNSGIYDASKIPIDESIVDNPKTPYDLNKLTSENYLKLYNQTYNVPYVIFRFATVYGPRQKVSEEWKPVIMEFITKLKEGITPTIYWDGEQTRDFIFVKDLVDALILALDNEQAIGETMILGTGKETSINQVYEKVSNLLGVKVLPLMKLKQLGDIRRMRYDCKKAMHILDWKPSTSLEEGIKNMLKFFGDTSFV